MADNAMRVPGGFGGIMRYDEEFTSRFMVSPAAVVGFVVFVILLIFALRVFFPLGA